MNFLAHAYLSGSDESVIIGNFIADRVKGKAWQTYPLGIQKGILLHRFIDDFTDKHPVNLESSRLLASYFGKYSMVVMDVMNDHLLAIHWEKYHTEPFETFVRNTYEIFQKHESLLPEKSRLMLPYMVRQNWLGSYRELEGIAEVLFRMSKRTPFISGMDKAIEPLQLHFLELEKNFHQFFPELKTACINFQSETF